jgi:hypothetical protein
MAKINFGSTVNDARGKIAGTVFSKNKSGAYIRTKVTPVNPRTVAQSAVRSSFAQLAQNWSTLLTGSQRSAWVSYAVTYPRRNIFGNALTLNGLNMYISLNQRLMVTGNALIADPPLTNSVDPYLVDSTWTDLSATEVKFTITGGPLLTTDWYYLFATKSLPAGRAVTPSDYRFIGAVSVDLTSPPLVVDVSAAYLAVFGAPIPGGAVYGLASTMDSLTGLITVGTPISGVVS